jgi:hypothetical protein
MEIAPLPNSSSSPRITLRALVLGVLTIFAVFYYLILEVGQASGSGSYVRSQFPMVAFMPFVLWLFLNTALGHLWPRLTLSRGELLTIFSMLWVVGALPQWGWSDYWIAITAAPFYLATPENQWSDLLIPYLPWHVLPDSSPQVLDAFWMGLPQGDSSTLERLDWGDAPVAGRLAGHGSVWLLPGGIISAPVDGDRKAYLSVGPDAAGFNPRLRRPAKDAPDLPL